jgi:hypothetical protein
MRIFRNEEIYSLVLIWNDRIPGVDIKTLEIIRWGSGHFELMDDRWDLDREIGLKDIPEDVRKEFREFLSDPFLEIDILRNDEYIINGVDKALFFKNLQEYREKL